MKLKIVWVGILLACASTAWAGGAVLNFVGPNSMYAKIGLQSGDQVVSVDGVAPKGAGDVGQFLYGIRGDGKRHLIQIIRDGKEKKLVVGP